MLSNLFCLETYKRYLPRDGHKVARTMARYCCCPHAVPLRKVKKAEPLRIVS